MCAIFLPCQIFLFLNFNSYIDPIQNIFFCTIRRTASPNNLAVTSWHLSWCLNPGHYGNKPESSKQHPYYGQEI
jgi:hypothetical protein